MKKRLFGALLALALTIAPFTASSVKFTNTNDDTNIITAEAGTKHYYIYKCDQCGLCVADGAVGKAIMKSHVKNTHKGGWYTHKDVCTSMGCHTSACDKSSNNEHLYWF